MNKENELELVLEQCEEVVDRKIPLLVLAPEYTKILMDYIKHLQQENKELHNKIDKAIKFIENEAYVNYEMEMSHNLYEGEIFELLEILKDSDVDD